MEEVVLEHEMQKGRQKVAFYQFRTDGSRGWYNQTFRRGIIGLEGAKKS
jgi:hypothetical protein